MTAAEAAKFEGVVKGVFSLPKPDNEAWTEAVKIFFDASAGLFTTDSDTGANPLVGVAAAAVGLSLVITSTAAGGDLSITSSITGVKLVVLNQANLAGETVTITLNGGTPTVLTEGVDWTAAVGDAATAASLAAAIHALPGLSSVPVLTLATNALAADLLIAGLTIQVLDFAQLGTDNATVTVTVNGVATVLTEGVEWTAAVSDDATATSLASAINAVTGLDAAEVTDTITVVITELPVVADSPSNLGRVRLDGVAR